MNIEIIDNSAYVRAPYHPQFYAKIKRCGSAKWDSEKLAWRVNAEQVPVVRKLMTDVFGESDIPAEGKRYDVQLKFHESVEALREGVYIFGKCLARARGRDSGAQPGSDVCYIEGGCTSGGSVKNWYSRVKEGSVVMLYDVPETLAQKEEREAGVEYKLIERIVNKDELEAEKNRLLARVEEINALLQAG